MCRPSRENFRTCASAGGGGGGGGAGGGLHRPRPPGARRRHGGRRRSWRCAGSWRRAAAAPAAGGGGSTPAAAIHTLPFAVDGDTARHLRPRIGRARAAPAARNLPAASYSSTTGAAMQHTLDDGGRPRGRQLSCPSRCRRAIIAAMDNPDVILRSTVTPVTDPMTHESSANGCRPQGLDAIGRRAPCADTVCSPDRATRRRPRRGARDSAPRQKTLFRFIPAPPASTGRLLPATACVEGAKYTQRGSRFVWRLNTGGRLSWARSSRYL